MSKNPHLDVLNTSVDRIPLAIPASGIFDNPAYYKKINIQWYRHLSGLVHGLTELSAWQGTTIEVQTAIDAIHSWLIRDIDVIENCDDVNDCLIPTLNRLSKNTFVTNMSVSNTQNQDRWQIWQETPLKPITAINKLATPAMSNNTQLSINYLCVASDYFVREYVAKLLDLSKQALQIGYTAEAVTIFTTTYAGLTLLAPMVAVLGGAVMWALDIGTGEIEDLIVALGDETAISEVICCLQQAMHMRSSSYNSYLLALQSDCYVLDSNAEKIAYFMNLHSSNERAYAFWIDCVSTARLCTIVDNCVCLTVKTCPADTLALYPASGGFNVGDGKTVRFNSTVTATPTLIGGTVYPCWVMSMGGVASNPKPWIEFEIDTDRCISGFTYTAFENNGINNLNFDVSVGDIVTGTGSTMNARKSVV